MNGRRVCPVAAPSGFSRSRFVWWTNRGRKAAKFTNNSCPHSFRVGTHTQGHTDRHARLWFTVCPGTTNGSLESEIYAAPVCACSWYSQPVSLKTRILKLGANVLAPVKFLGSLYFKTTIYSDYNRNHVLLITSFKGGITIWVPTSFSVSNLRLWATTSFKDRS